MENTELATAAATLAAALAAGSGTRFTGLDGAEQEDFLASAYSWALAMLTDAHAKETSAGNLIVDLDV
jgi:hypothetical protein